MAQQDDDDHHEREDDGPDELELLRAEGRAAGLAPADDADDDQADLPTAAEVLARAKTRHV